MLSVSVLRVIIDDHTRIKGIVLAATLFCGTAVVRNEMKTLTILEIREVDLHSE